MVSARDTCQAYECLRVAGGGHGAVYVDEEVVVDEGKPDRKHEKSESGDAGQEASADGDAAAPAAGAGDDGHDTKKKKKKKIRRRVEPLPEFASSAQEELVKLESDFEAAQKAYQGTYLRRHRFHVDWCDITRWAACVGLQAW